MPKAPELHQRVVKVARRAFGGDECNVRKHYDEPETTTIHSLECPDRPARGFSAYTTVGLYLEPNLMDDQDIRVELAGVAWSSAKRFRNMLAPGTYNLTKDAWLCAPGVVFPGLVSEYDLRRRSSTSCGRSPSRGRSWGPSRSSTTTWSGSRSSRRRRPLFGLRRRTRR